MVTMPDFSVGQLAADKPVCPNARSFGQLCEQVVFAHLSAESTPEDYCHAQNLLLAMCERFAANLDLFHFPVVVGTHWCVREVYEDASCRLACLAALRKPPKPEPVPEPPPEPPEPEEPSLENVVDTFEKTDELLLSDTDNGDSRD
jgi:hypothetical protein